MSVLHTKNFLCLLRIQQLFYVCEFLARFGSLHHLGALSHSLADIRPRPGDAQFSSVLACSGRAAMYAVVHSYDATSLFDCVNHPYSYRKGSLITCGVLVQVDHDRDHDREELELCVEAFSERSRSLCDERHMGRIGTRCCRMSR